MKKRTGTIIERGGHYHIRYMIEGCRFQVPLRTTSATEAEKFAERFMRDRQGGLDQYENFLRGELARVRRFRSVDDLKAFPLVEAWNEFLKSPGRPKAGLGTLSHYKSAWTQFIADLPAARKHLSDITHKDATNRMESIYKSGMSQGTADKHLIYLTAILKALLPKGIDNPFTGEVARGTYNVEDLSYLPVTLEQMQAVCGTLLRFPVDYGGGFA